MHDKIFEKLDPAKPLPGVGGRIYPGRARGALWVMAKILANATTCQAQGGGPHMNRGDGLCACGQPAVVQGVIPYVVAQEMAKHDPEIRSVWDVIPVMDWLERQGAIRVTHAPGIPAGVRLYEIVPEQGLAGSAPLGGAPVYPGPGAPFSPTVPMPGTGPMPAAPDGSGQGPHQ